MQGLEATFVEDLKEGYNLCYTMTKDLPVEDIKNPAKSMFFKQYMFQKCANVSFYWRSSEAWALFTYSKFQKKETELCIKKKLAEWTELKYGKYDDAKAQALGLPKDK